MTRRLPAIALTLAALAAGGCGGDDEQAGLIPRDQAESLLGGLDDAEQLFRDDECDELTDEAIPDLEQEVGQLPPEVKPDLRTALTRGVEELGTLAEDCQEPEPPPTTTETLPPPTTAPPTTAPPTETQTETETETEPDSAPGQGQGQGGTPPGQGGTPPGGGGSSGGDE